MFDYKTKQRLITGDIFPSEIVETEIWEDLSEYCDPDPKEYNLQYSYGIGLKQYDEMFDKQGGCCDICGDIPIRHSLNVDHCHATEKVRALLCRTCNLGLGHFRNNPTRLVKAAKYLIKHRDINFK